MHLPISILRSLRSTIAVLSVCGLLGLLGPLTTASAGTTTENEEAFKRADSELNTLYQDILASINRPAAKESFVKAQRVWIEFRDAEAGAENAVAVSINATNKEDLQPVKTALTSERTQALQRFKASLH